ncbi:MAG: type 4a pilus biogenesis protein PilO [Clostridium sp.]|nr:type 4a pilus biogenesis protein PilO [Clostridium sp.]
MNKLSKKEKIEVFALGIILILIIYFEFVVSPILKINSNYKDEINDLNNKYTDMINMENSNKQFVRNINKLSDKYKKSSIGLPVGVKDAEIENSINTLCSKNNLKFNDISFNEPMEYTGKTTTMAQNGNNSQPNNNNGPKKNIKAGTVMEIPTVVTVSGSYGDIVKFISSLEKDNRIFTVIEFTVSDGDNGGNVKAAVNGYYYYFTGDKKPHYNFNIGKYGKSDLFN